MQTLPRMAAGPLAKPATPPRVLPLAEVPLLVLEIRGLTDRLNINEIKF